MNNLDDAKNAINALEPIWPLWSELLSVRRDELIRKLIKEESEQLRGRILEIDLLLGTLDRFNDVVRNYEAALSEESDAGI